MDKAVLLTKVDYDKKVVLNSFGLMNQSVLASVKDAIYHLLITNPIGCEITLTRSSEDFTWVTIKDHEEVSYYEIREVKPLTYA